jgi:hypothetical protein
MDSQSITYSNASSLSYTDISTSNCSALWSGGGGAGITSIKINRLTASAEL